VTSIGETNVTNLSIPCGIVGAPSPTVTWLKDGNHVQNASVDETSNLIISSVELKHEGKYTCLATNLLGNLKREIQVTVRSKNIDEKNGIFFQPMHCRQTNSDASAHAFS